MDQNDLERAFKAGWVAALQHRDRNAESRGNVKAAAIKYILKIYGRCPYCWWMLHGECGECGRKCPCVDKKRGDK